MEREKVKEIKKGLECCKQNEIEDTCKYCLDCPASDWDYEKECKIDLFQKTITLINELKNELETRKDEVLHLQEYGKKLIRETELKQFAEKLKNKLFEFFQDNEEPDGKISVGPLYVDVIGVEAKDGTIISLGLIDRLLKEYEK